MRALALALALLATAAGALPAATYHLNADGTGDFPTIAAAIAAANPGDSILLAAGLFLGAGNTQLDYGGKDIVIAGAGPGETILDCGDSGQPVVRFQGGETRSAVLRGLTLRNNYSQSHPPGIRISSASPTLANLELADFDGACGDEIVNPYAGAAIRSVSGSPLVKDTVLRDCGCAGTVAMTGGAPEIEGVTIENADHSYGNGSGLILVNSAAVVRETVFRGCESFEGGGAVSCSGAISPVFEDCRFEGNVANSEWGSGRGAGGALCCLTGVAPILRRCIFVDNEARDGGGAIAARASAHPVLEDVLIADCGSNAGGSAIYLDGASAALRGVTIAGGRFMDSNEQNVPSAVLCLGSSPTLERVIIAHNEVGLGLWADSTSAPSLLCCDVVGNPEGNFGGSIADPTGSDGNISLDPLFCGGDEPETAFGIASGSPCAPAHSPCCLLIGALPVGCELDAVRISGEIAFASGEPLGGVQIAGAGYPIWSDAAGAYELVVPVGWSGVLTPALTGYGFTPASRSYTSLITDMPDQDYTAERITVRRVPAEVPTIQAAIDLSLSGDVVLVAPGTYSGPGFLDITLSGKDVYIVSEAGSAGTIIDCEGNGRGFCIGSDVTSTTWIMGFTVRNGYAPNYDGGGLKISYAMPILRDIVVENCRARFEGGGIKLYYADALFEDVVVRGCEAYADGYSHGGGIHCMGSAPTLRRVLLADNHSYEEGGGLYCHSGSPILEQVTLVANSSVAGGGIACGYNSDPQLSGCLIAENAATDTGGIYCHDAASIPTVACSDIDANAGGDYGGTLADQTGLNGNISENPRFCDAASGDYRVEAGSPCLPANNGCGIQMGAYGEGCDLTAAGKSPSTAFAFAAPQPNPFNPKTTLRFALPRAAAVDLAIFDVNGRHIAHLLDGASFPAGQHAIDWNGCDETGRTLASGVYFARLAAGGFTAEQKLVLLR